MYGNDAPDFGQTYTIPVGNGPDALTILRDGSRVYVANQKDSTVSVVNLSTYQVEATVPVVGHPISIASVASTPYGQVYVVSSDQPYLTVIRTDTDAVNASLQLDGEGVDVHATAQQAGAPTAAGSIYNAINVSHASGSGAPCGFGATYYLASGPCSLLTSSRLRTYLPTRICRPAGESLRLSAVSVHLRRMCQALRAGSEWPAFRPQVPLREVAGWNRSA